MEVRTQRRRDHTGIGLHVALAASLLVHVLFLGLAGLIPASWLSSSAPPPEETVLRFRLVQPEPPEASPESLLGSSAPETGGEVPYRGGGANDAGAATRRAPSLPVPTVETPSPAPERSVRLPEPPVPAPTGDAESEQTEGQAREAEGTGIEERVEGSRAVDPNPPAPTRPGARPLDLNEALRDFREAVRRRPAPPARQEPGGGGAAGIDLPPLPSSGFGFGNLQFESSDYDWSDYARQIYVAIWRAWYRRLYATIDHFERWGFENRQWLLDHASRVRFTIVRNGEVTAIVLEQASGCEPLDASALDALDEVILPPLPRDFPRDRETIHARFVAQADVRAMRQQLGWMHRMGYF